MTLWGPPVFKYGTMRLTAAQLEERAKRQQADIEAVGMARTFETCGRCNGFGVFRRSFQTRTCPDCAGIGWVPKPQHSCVTCEHILDDGRCLLCAVDLEYTPG